MFGIGMPEMVVIIVIALVVLGPKRLPEVARALGKGLAEFRKVTGDVNRELEAARNMIEAEAREHDESRRRAEREARERAAAAPAAATSAQAGAAEQAATSTGPEAQSDQTATQGEAPGEAPEGAVGAAPGAPPADAQPTVGESAKA